MNAHFITDNICVYFWLQLDETQTVEWFECCSLLIGFKHLHTFKSYVPVAIRISTKNHRTKKDGKTCRNRLSNFNWWQDWHSVSRTHTSFAMHFVYLHHCLHCIHHLLTLSAHISNYIVFLLQFVLSFLVWTLFLVQYPLSILQKHEQIKTKSQFLKERMENEGENILFIICTCTCTCTSMHILYICRAVSRKGGRVISASTNTSSRIHYTIMSRMFARTRKSNKKRQIKWRKNGKKWVIEYAGMKRWKRV